MSNIIERLRRDAEEQAESRRIAEFGPGGGNPNAKAEDHLSWEAAEEICTIREERDLLTRILRLIEWKPPEGPCPGPGECDLCRAKRILEISAKEQDEQGRTISDL